MPSVSKKQARTMAAAAHNPAFAKKVGIPVGVAKEFNRADKGLKFGKDVSNTEKINNPKVEHGKSALFSKGGEMKESKAMAKKEIAFMQKKGAPKSMIKHEKAEYGMKAGGTATCKTEAKKEVKAHEKRLHGMKAGGRIAAKGEHPVQKQAKRGAQMIKMCGGGKVMKKSSGRGR